MKFSVKQREIILTQIVDNIEIYGSPTVAAENLSYVIHCVKTIPDYNIDWNHQNQLMLWFHKLDLGKQLKIKSLPTIDDLHYTERESPFSINSLNNKFGTEVMREKGSLGHCMKKHEAKSISLPQHLSSDFVGSKIFKADSIAIRREEVNKIRKTSSRSVTRRNLVDKDKSVYK